VKNGPVARKKISGKKIFSRVERARLTTLKVSKGFEKIHFRTAFL